MATNNTVARVFIWIGLLLAPPVAAHAELVWEDLTDPDDMLVILDTKTGNRWLDLNVTFVPDFLAPQMDEIAASRGYRLATPLEVCQLFALNLSGFAGPCPRIPTLPLGEEDLVAVDAADANIFMTRFGPIYVDPATGANVAIARCGSLGSTVDCVAIVALDESPSRAGAGDFTPVGLPSPGASAYWYVKVPEPLSSVMSAIGAGWSAIIGRVRARRREEETTQRETEIGRR